MTQHEQGLVAENAALREQLEALQAGKCLHQIQEPMTGQCRFKGHEWGACHPEHVAMVLSNLKSLLERGYTVTGYALEKPVGGAQPDRGFIDHGGFVGWWWDGQTPQAQSDARDADKPMVNMTPPATSRDRWMYQQGRLAEREEICAAIKAEDDHCVTQGDYMLDSDDCIKVARGEWVRPIYDAAIAAAKGGKQ